MTRKIYIERSSCPTMTGNVYIDVRDMFIGCFYPLGIAALSVTPIVLSVAIGLAIINKLNTNYGSPANFVSMMFAKLFGRKKTSK